jgi:hypothetical protein
VPVQIFAIKGKEIVLAEECLAGLGEVFLVIGHRVGAFEVTFESHRGEASNSWSTTASNVATRRNSWALETVA